MWYNDGLRVRNEGKLLGNMPETGGFLLTIAGRTIGKDGSLGGYVSHRCPTTYWYPTEEKAEEALVALSSQEDRSVHPMKTLQQTLLGVVASCFYAPSLLPESFIHDGKVYNVSYERADDDSMIKITAWDPETAKDIASLEIR